MEDDQTHEALPQPAPASLQTLPGEIIQNIAFHLAPQAATLLGATCRRLRDMIDLPLLWRHYCASEYRYWDVTKITDQRILDNDPLGPWRQHFLNRMAREKRFSTDFESALPVQQRRYAKLRSIADWGYEAQDMLVKHCQAPDSCEDVLLRRYFAEATFGSINREQAVRIWQKLLDGTDTNLEEQMVAFDLFVAGSQLRTVGDVPQALDKIAADIKNQWPDIMEFHPRHRAVAIARHLLDRGLVGIEGSGNIRSMKHNFLRFTLLHGSRKSLPLQSAVIFCSVAQRLGVEAHPINYPYHVYVVILLDGAQISDLPNNTMTIYLNPWSSSQPLALSDLRDPLRAMGLPEIQIRDCLVPATPRLMVVRTCHNIMRAHQDFSRGVLEEDQPLINHDALYAYLWCMAIVEDGRADLTSIRPHIARFLPFFRDNFPLDLELVNRYLLPHFGLSPDRHDYVRQVGLVQQSDAMLRPIVHREGTRAANVKYRIGQMMQHKRYGYIGIIRRWDDLCLGTADWQMTQGVNMLSQGANQPFYDILAEDKTLRYVAQENIEPYFSEPSEELKQMAGRFFKRYDADRRMFVSNLRNEYPDD